MSAWHHVSVHVSQILDSQLQKYAVSICSEFPKEEKRVKRHTVSERDLEPCQEDFEDFSAQETILGAQVETIVRQAKRNPWWGMPENRVHCTSGEGREVQQLCFTIYTPFPQWLIYGGNQHVLQRRNIREVSPVHSAFGLDETKLRLLDLTMVQPGRWQETSKDLRVPKVFDSTHTTITKVHRTRMSFYFQRCLLF